MRDAEQSLRVLIGQLADAIPEGGEPLRQIVAGLETPDALANVAAAELIADVSVRQRLLETRDVGRAAGARHRGDRGDDGAAARARRA